MSWRSLLTLVSWSAVVVVGGTAGMAGLYVLLVVPLGDPVTFREVFKWLVAIWSVWILIAPAIVLATRRYIAGRPDPRSAWLRHGLSVAGVLAVHLAWTVPVSLALSPYLTYQEVSGVLNFFARYAVPPDVAMYGALVLGASRADLQRALAESERQYRSIFENAVIGIFRTTADGRYMVANAATARALGYESPEQLLTEVHDLGTDLYVDPADRAAYLRAIRRDGYVVNWPSRLRRRDGSLMWIVENSRGVFADNGTLLYVEGTTRDMTEEMQAREALDQAERRAAELRAQLADAQLRALKLQLKPHFLFNILNTVTMMIRNGDTEPAEELIALLGGMFRHVLELEGEDQVTLDQELAFLDLYIRIQQFRYEGRMTVHRDIGPGTRNLLVPTIILQPIMENAIKHGVAEMLGPCRIDLTAQRADGRLTVTVVNDVGNGETEPGPGIGVRNTRARLAQLYGDRGSFELIPGRGRMRAVLTIPAEDLA